MYRNVERSHFRSNKEWHYSWKNGLLSPQNSPLGWVSEAPAWLLDSLSAEKIRRELTHLTETLHPIQWKVREMLSVNTIATWASIRRRKSFFSPQIEHTVYWFCGLSISDSITNNTVLPPAPLTHNCLDDVCSQWPFIDLTTYQLWLLHTWSTSASSGNCTGHTESNRSNYTYYKPWTVLAQ